ncbi:hypothetical protein B0I37DRAFT_443798 [Chaetomium sp. MPI-CAGE-AT-0009]|nr:hypothetical protein B0I37DRAFT_443798 [Chaetomium sp. MPI-CAGE-AT-0009]
MSGPYQPPSDGFKALSLDKITDIYTKAPQHVYPVARDIAKELDAYALGFVKSAKERIEELVEIAQGLKWENEKLIKEAEEARKVTAEAVNIIHKFLTGGELEDLRKYKADEEHKAVEKKAAA